VIISNSRNGEEEMTERVEQNKRNVIEFYNLMFNDCQPAEAIVILIQDYC
jgi:hypothetical protein